MPEQNVTTKFKADVSGLVGGLKQADAQLRVIKSEFASVSDGTKSWEKSVDGMQKHLEILGRQLEQQNKKLEIYKKELATAKSYQEQAKNKVQGLKQALEEAKKEYGENSDEVKKLEKELKQAEIEEAKMDKTVNNLTKSLNYEQGAINKTNAEMSRLNGKLDDAGESSEKADKDVKTLNKDVDTLGETSGQTSEKIGTLAKGIVTGLAKAMAVGIATIGAGVAKLTKDSLQMYSQFEQLQGGIKTLYGTDDMNINQYAKSVGKSVSQVKKKYKEMQDSEKIITKNSQQAFKTTGLSATQYMEQATSFGASLISYLKGDTKKASQYTDRAIRDMSDNANKMGTDISSIQNAYQGFAKGNMGMLDNLKLGFGGSQAEAKRLVKEASKMKKEQKDLNVTVKDGSLSFDNIVNAISVMQKHLRITGTTSKEASKTMEGSVNTMKASWSNLLLALSSDDFDLDTAIKDFFESLKNVFKNFEPRIKIILDNIFKMIESFLPELVSFIVSQAPNLLNALLGAFNKFIQMLPSLFKNLTSTTLPSLFNTIINILPQLTQNLISLFSKAIKGLADNLDSIVLGTLKLGAVLGKAVIDSLPELLNSLKALFVKIGEMIPEGIEFLMQNLPSWIEKIGAKIPEILAYLTPKVKELLGFLGQKLPELILVIGENLPSIISAVGDMLAEHLPEIIDALVEFIGDLFSQKEKFSEKIGEHMPEIIIDSFIALSNAKEKIVNALAEKLWEIIKDGIKKAWEQAWADVMKSTGLDTILDWLQDIFRRLQLFYQDVKNIDWGSIWDKLKSGTKQAWDFVKNIVSGSILHVLGSIKTVGKAINVVNGVFNSIHNTIRNIMINIFKTVNKYMEQIIGIFPKPLQNIIKGFRGTGENSALGFWDGIKAKKDWLLGKVGGFAKSVVDKAENVLGIHSPSKVFRDRIGKNIGYGLAQGLDQSKKTVTKSISNLIKLTVSTAKSTFKSSGFESVSKNIVSSFTKTIDNTVKNSTNSVNTLIKTQNDAYQNTLSKNQQKKYKTFLDNVTKSYQNVLANFQKNAKNILNNTLDNLVKTYEDKFKKITDAYNSMTSKLSSFGDVFTKVNDNLIILNDLEAQTKAITDYEKVLKSLKKSISTDLFDYVAGLDVQTGQAYAETLLNMTDEERKKYDKAYVNKLTQAQKLSDYLYKDDIKKLNQEYNKAVDNALKDVSKKVSNLGKQAINGLITGMKGQTKNLGTEVQRLANTLIKQFKKALKIKSPSRRLADEIGKFVPLGLAQGIKENTKGLINEVKAMSEQVVATARGLDVGNIIPDMSNIKALRPNSYADLQGYNGNVYNYTFNQTNTSPKALDRLEIYKQTQQQLNFAKLVMNNG